MVHRFNRQDLLTRLQEGREAARELIASFRLGLALRCALFLSVGKMAYSHCAEASSLYKAQVAELTAKIITKLAEVSRFSRAKIMAKIWKYGSRTMELGKRAGGAMRLWRARAAAMPLLVKAVVKGVVFKTFGEGNGWTIVEGELSDESDWEQVGERMDRGGGRYVQRRVGLGAGRRRGTALFSDEPDWEQVGGHGERGQTGSWGRCVQRRRAGLGAGDGERGRYVQRRVGLGAGDCHSPRTQRTLFYPGNDALLLGPLLLLRRPLLLHSSSYSSSSLSSYEGSSSSSAARSSSRSSSPSASLTASSSASRSSSSSSSRSGSEVRRGTDGPWWRTLCSATSRTGSWGLSWDTSVPERLTIPSG